jgi:hypothetical protein
MIVSISVRLKGKEYQVWNVSLSFLYKCYLNVFRDYKYLAEEEEESRNWDGKTERKITVKLCG